MRAVHLITILWKYKVALITDGECLTCITTQAKSFIKKVKNQTFSTLSHLQDVTANVLSFGF